MRNFVSARVQSIPPSGIRKFFDIAATMDDVISLSIGEPDFVPAAEAHVMSVIPNWQLILGPFLVLVVLFAKRGLVGLVPERRDG